MTPAGFLSKFVIRSAISFEFRFARWKPSSVSQAAFGLVVAAKAMAAGLEPLGPLLVSILLPQARILCTQERCPDMAAMNRGESPASLRWLGSMRSLVSNIPRRIWCPKPAALQMGGTAPSLVPRVTLTRVSDNRRKAMLACPIWHACKKGEDPSLFGSLTSILGSLMRSLTTSSRPR